MALDKDNLNVVAQAVCAVCQKNVWNVPVSPDFNAMRPPMQLDAMELVFKSSKCGWRIMGTPGNRRIVCPLCQPAIEEEEHRTAVVTPLSLPEIGRLAQASCPKCKSAEIRRKWCPYCVRCSGEHLHHVCSTCGYQWLTQTADNVSAEKSA